MTAKNQIAGKPGDHEIEKIVAGKVAESGAPERTLSQDICRAQRRTVGVRNYAAITRHPFKPSWKPQQADKTDPDEYGTPAIFHHQKSGAERAYCVARAQGRHESATGEATMMFWKTARKNLRTRGQSNGFSNAKNQTHCEQQDEAANQPCG